MKLTYWVLIIISIAVSNISACDIDIHFENEEAEDEYYRTFYAKTEFPTSLEAIESLHQKNYSITAKKFRQLRQTADYLIFWKQTLPFYILDVAERISSSNNIKLKLAMMDYDEYAEEYEFIITDCDWEPPPFATLFYKHKPHTYSYWKHPEGWIDFYDFEEEFVPKLGISNASLPYYSYYREKKREDFGYSYDGFYDPDWPNERLTFLKLAPEYKENTYATWMITYFAEMMGVHSIEYDSLENIEKYTRYISGCVLFIGDASSSLYKDYIDTIFYYQRAKHKRELIFINSNSDEIKKAYGAEENALILFANRGEKKFVFDKVPSSENYNRFIDEIFFMPTQLRRQKPVFVLLFKDNSEASRAAEETFRMAAKDLWNEAVFIIRDVDENSDSRLLNEACVRRQTTLPTIRFMQDEKKRYFAFPLEGEITPENIKNGLRLYREGKIQRLEKSQDILDPAYVEAVRLIGKDTWDEVVLDETKNRLIWTYCYQLSIFIHIQELYKKYGSKSDMVFAAIDRCQNDIELWPNTDTARLYLKGSKDQFEFSSSSEDRQISILVDKIYRPEDQKISMLVDKIYRSDKQLTTAILRNNWFFISLFVIFFLG